MFAHLLPPTFKEQIISWIQEDIPSYDIGGFVVGEKEETANLYCKASSSYTTVVISGRPFVETVFDYFGLSVEWFVEEGDKVDTESNAKVIVAKVRGKCRNILMAERTALNIISRASGVATLSRRISDRVLDAGWKGQIAGKISIMYLFN